jgi:predicted metal-dependent phosphoesterase TrpH
VRIDLHTHSSVSDGTDRPDALVQRAARAGLAVVALTDHDTFDGWSKAIGAARSAGITVVPGVEMSTTLHGAGIHVLGYLPDPDYRPLDDELARIRADRADRLHALTQRLTELGMPLTVADVLVAAGEATTLGRPHVADAMIAKGYVRDRRAAFSKWLAAGGPAFVPKYAPPTVDAIGLIRAAGGVAVLAHPWGRGSRQIVDAEVLDELAAAGLGGIEVDHVDHSEAARAGLRKLAAEFDLIVTGSSDYHGRGKAGHHLGTHTTDVEEYHRLVELAAETARGAGRVGPRPAGVDAA